MLNFDLEQYLFDKAKLNGRPVRAVLELTPVCNFNCEICYIRHSAKEACEAGGVKSVDFWKQVIAQMEKMGVLIVTLIGGEPLLYEGFAELYTELRDRGFLVNITTNGSVITNEIIQLFTEKPPRYVTVSLYGASKESYERVTGNPNGYDMTMAGIKKLLDANIPVKLNYVMAPNNKDDLEAIYKIKEEHHLPLLADAYCFPACRRPMNEKQNRLSPEECAKYHMMIKKQEKKDEFINYCKRITCNEFKRNEAMRTETINCYAGSALFWVNWHGEMMPCGFLEQFSVPIDSENMEDAWCKIKDMVRAVHTSKKCSQCDYREFCHVCSAAMYWENGNFEDEPTYLCEMTNNVIKIAQDELK